MKRKNWLSILIIILVAPNSIYLSASDDTDSFFNLNIIATYSNIRCPGYSLYPSEILPEIGISPVNYHSMTVGDLSLRTWAYPYIDYDYIPSFDQGGFDLYNLNAQWDIEWNPFKWFSAQSLIFPHDWNFCQFVNSTYASALHLYVNALEYEEMFDYIAPMQQVLYEELPTITLYYPSDIFLLSSDIEYFEPILYSLNEFNAELWNMIGDNEMIFAHPFNINTSSQYRGSPNNFEYPLPNMDSKWMHAVYGSLFRRNTDTHQYEPSIAQNYTISPDRYSMTINLKTPIQFSNGDQLSAEDIKYTYDLLKTPAMQLHEYRNPYDYMIANVTVEDSDTVKFYFNRPISLLINNELGTIFELLNFGIIKKSLVEPLVSTYGYDIFRQDPFTTNVSDVLITSCGPFKLANFNSENMTLALVSNEYWFGEGPCLDGIKFEYYPTKDAVKAEIASGNVEVADSNYFFYPDDAYGLAEVIVAPSLSSEELFVNMLHPIIGTGELTPLGTTEAAKCVRKAISHALSRDYIVQACYDSESIPGVTSQPYGSLGFDQGMEPYTYNITLAKEYMTAAGYEFDEETTTPVTGLNILISLISLSFVGSLIAEKRKRFK